MTSLVLNNRVKVSRQVVSAADWIISPGYKANLVHNCMAFHWQSLTLSAFHSHDIT